MKKRWLYGLLILSLAVNAGVLVAVGVSRYQTWRHVERYWRENLRSRQAVGRMDRLFKELEKKRDPWRKRYRSARCELGRLGLAPNPDSMRFAAVLDSLVTLDTIDHRLMFELGQEMQKLLNPKWAGFWRRHALAVRDSLLREDSLLRRSAKGER